MEDTSLNWDFVQAIWVLLSVTFEEASPQFEPVGLGIKQMVFLAVLDKQSTPRQLREMFAAPASTISNHINELEKKGLVVRDIHPTDRRQYILRKTPAGQEALTVGINAVNAKLAERSKTLSDEEREAFAVVQRVIARWVPSGN